MNKQETLEEARLTYLKNRYYKSSDSESFLAGAKCQKEISDKEIKLLREELEYEKRKNL